MSEKEKEAAETNKTIGLLDKKVVKPLEEEQQKLPENFKVARAIGGGDCFFDSVAKGLKQIRVDEDINIKQLRELCVKYAVENEWVKTAVVKDARSNIPSTLEDDQIWNAYLLAIRFAAYEMENMKRIDKVLYNTLTTPDYGETLLAPIWGRPEIEGRIVCEKYNVNLHIVEKHNVDVKHQIVDKSGPKSVDNVDYNDINTIHVVRESNGNCKPIFKTQKIQHKRWEETTYGLKGLSYEVYLLILCRLRGQRYTDKFYLTTNMSGIGAFNDIVLRYWKKGKSTVILLQAMYVENSKKSKLTFESDNRFYLGKYFADYLISRSKINERSEDPMFQGVFQVKYIIYTNAIRDEKCKKTGKIDIDTNRILSTKSKENKNTAFKFSLDDRNSGLIAMLENVSCQERIKLLAKVLVSCISGKLNYNNMMGNELFSTYHVFLAKNVIDVKEEIKVDEAKIEYREGTIKPSFFNNDRNDRLEKELKREILYEYAKTIMFNQKPSAELGDDDKRNDLVNKVANLATSCDKRAMELDEDIIRSLGGCAIVLDTIQRRFKFADEDKLEDDSAKQFIRDLKSKVSNLAAYKFNISNDLVQKTLKKQLEQEPLKLHVSFGNISLSFVEQKHLIEQLIKLFEKYKAKKVIKIDDDVVGHGKVLTDGDLSNIGRLVGNLLVYDQEEDMLRLASEDSLDENALELIKELKATAAQRDLEVDTYRFDIKVKNFPKCSLDVNSEDRTNVEEFFNELEVCTDRASDQEFIKIIKNEIRNLYKLTEEEVEDNFLNFKEKGEEYWRERKNKSYLEKDDDFYQSILMYHNVFNVRKPVEFFTGRFQELQKLHKALQRSSFTAISQTASISGHRGIGKTELARKYAFDYRNYYDGNVIWINSESYQTLFESFRWLAQYKLGINVKEKDIKCIVDEVYDFYSNRKCLFIFDNAERCITRFDSDEGIKIFLPFLSSNTHKPYILITSRKQIWGNIEVIQLENFIQKDATDFIVKELQIVNHLQKNEIQKLSEILQQFPLALTQAVTYIEQVYEEVKHEDSERGFKIDDYLTEYENKYKKILDFPFTDDSNDKYNRTLFTTFQVSVDKIKKNKYGQKALELLDVIAYCAPDNIPFEIFSNLGQDEDDAKREFKAAVQLLEQYSMVNSDDGLLCVPRLVQEVARINVMDEKREEKTLRKALELLKCYDSKYRCEYQPSVIGKQNSKIVETFGDWWKHNTSSRSISTKEKKKLTNAGKSSMIERHASNIWSYASEYGELIKDFYSDYGEKGNTPINLFAINGDLKAVQSLLKNIQGKLMNTVIEFNKIGYAPIHSAAFHGHKEIVKYLIEEQDVDVNFFINISEHTPLVVAVLGYQLHILQYLLRIKGADPNKRGKNGQLPIHYAAQNARMDLVECLVNNNANICIKDELFRNNVLHYALRHLNVCNMHLSDVEEILRYFLEKKSILLADANNSGMTPLHLAAELGHAGIVKMFLDYGANVNARFSLSELRVANITRGKSDLDVMKNIRLYDNYAKGYTPLHIAAKENHLEIVKLLLQKGAKYNAFDNEGRTPHDIGELNSDVTNLLVCIDRSFKAILNGGRDELDCLLTGKDSDVLKSILNARDRSEKTLLQVATNEQVDIIKVLLEKLILCSMADQQQETE